MTKDEDNLNFENDIDFFDRHFKKWKYIWR